MSSIRSSCGVFFTKMGWLRRKIRVIPLPHGSGSGEKHVRDRFPKELKAYRRRRNRVHCNLVVMIDGDRLGVEDRIQQLDDECREQGIDPRTRDDMVVICVPTWQIESWIAYLDGQNVDENHQRYPKLLRPRDCQTHVNVLLEMYQGQRESQNPVPDSLVQSCREFGRLRQ